MPTLAGRVPSYALLAEVLTQPEHWPDVTDTGSAQDPAVGMLPARSQKGSTMTRRMPALIALLIGVVGGALIAGSALIGASAQPAPTSVATSTASAGTAGACGWGSKRLPAKLRADLRAARALPVGERRPALRKIARAARAGDYGKRVQKFAKNRHHLHKLVRSKLPADFRADLKKARHLPVGERKPALKQIRTDALAGKYGDRVHKLVKHRLAHRAACKAKRSSSTA